MKKQLLCLALAALLLAGCAKSYDINQVAKLYYNASTITAQADISEKFGAAQDYTVSFEKSGDNSSVSIEAPELLKGVTAQVSGSTATIAFDGASAETLLPSLSGFTPVDALHCIVSDLARKLPQDYCFETVDKVDYLVMTYEEEIGESQTQKKLWLIKSNLAISHAEMYVGGIMIMDISFKAFQLY